MKIGIYTFHFALNYGAVIQAWALQSYLLASGYDAFIVDYNPTVGFVRKWWRALRRGFFITLMELKFAWFRFCHLRIIHFGKSDRLDVAVVGSDQVWNLRYFPMQNLGYNGVYFFKNLPLTVRRISYAASVGDGGWAEFPKIKEVKENLLAFDGISVREECAKRELETVGVESLVVVDPTLLLERRFYDCLISSGSKKKKYVFCYTLSEPEMVCTVVNEISRCSGLATEVVALSSMERVVCEKLIEGMRVRFLAPSPRGWLKLIRDAEFVITDSFHGLMLSICFHRDFAVVLKPERQNMNSRITEILKKLGLDNRIVRGKDAVQQIFQRKIQWEHIDQIISQLRSESKKFLRDSLHET